MPARVYALVFITPFHYESFSRYIVFICYLFVFSHRSQLCLPKLDQPYENLLVKCWHYDKFDSDQSPSGSATDYKPAISDVNEEKSLSDDNGKLHGYRSYPISHNPHCKICLICRCIIVYLSHHPIYGH